MGKSEGTYTSVINGTYMTVIMMYYETVINGTYMTVIIVTYQTVLNGIYVTVIIVTYQTVINGIYVTVIKRKCMMSLRPTRPTRRARGRVSLS